MNWTTVIEGVIAGVSASLAFAALLALRNKVRDRSLEKAIRRGIRRTGIGVGIESLGIAVQNDSEVDFQVRSVSVATPSASFTLNPSPNGASELPSALRAIPGRHGDSTSHATEAVAKAFAFFQFDLNASFLQYYEGPITSVEVEVAYREFSGKPRVLRESLSSDSVEVGQSLLNQLEKQYLDGSLNEARLRFGLPAIQARRQKA